MAITNLIDGEQLDAYLTTLADAVRAKSNTNATMTFPSGFVTAINNILGENSGSWDNFVNGTFPSGDAILTSAVTTIPSSRFLNNTAVTSITGPGVTKVNSGAFMGCKNLRFIDFPALTTIYATGSTAAGAQCFADINGGYITTIYFPVCRYAPGTNNFRNLGTISAPVTVVLPSLELMGGSFLSGAKLVACDLGPNLQKINSSAFSSASVPIIILRSTTITPLDNTNAFTSSNFASGGAGGTIYIPQVLYDHLGDETSNDYKAATNWSTIDGYGTITWAKIEGSQYENYYANGVAISS